MCLSDIHAKKIPTPTEKVVLQIAGLGFKKIKFDLEADEVSVYNQLTSSSSGNSQPGELTSGYSQLQSCGGFELMKCIPNCKVLEPLECQISAKNLKAAAGQGKIYIRPIQYCKEQDFNNPVEILKDLQEKLVQCRPLEIADASQYVDGETNFIMVDRSNLLNFATEEIHHLKNKFLTLEVQFYNEV